MASILQSEFRMSRRLLRQLIESIGVTCNGAPVYMTMRVQLGDEIKIELPMETSDVPSEPMKLDIRYEDDEIIVINKPPGTLTHPTARERTGSLLSGVRHYLSQSGTVPHSVHRLDRDTSGVVMFAKHAHTHHLFDIALRDSAMHRQYVALVYCGQPVQKTDAGTLVLASDMPMLQPTHDGWHTINLPIAQDPNQPSRRIIADDGQHAVSHFRILGKVGKVATVQLVLETGRTHQIRLHMAAIGMPLLGDHDYTMVYSGLPTPLDANSYRRLMLRQALHAYRLNWTHPITKVAQGATAPVLDDMTELWAELGGEGAVWDML